MATNVDTELNEFPINSVSSDEVLKQMEAEGLSPHQLYFTPDSGTGGGGSKVIWEVWE
jgi:hypothetical protein